MGINSVFKEAVERATSPSLLEPDWAAILQVCDSIRQQDVSGKVAVCEIKKKIFDSNPHVSKNAIITLEACVKNCGSVVHNEVATKDLMDDLRQYIQDCPETNKKEILRLIQAWAYGFRNEPKYKIVEDTKNLLRMEGYSFPSRSESDAMFSALRAPDWAEGDTCHRCRTKFSTFTRQHHCRCCGQVFCAKCSSKNSTVPKFGIEREVRVCDPCFDSLNPTEGRSSKPTPDLPKTDLPPEYLKSSLSKESQLPEKKSSDEIKRQEQEDLQLAMALSVSEQESKKGIKTHQISNIYATIPETRPSAPSLPSSYIYSTPSLEEGEDEEVDPELSHYLDRAAWEKKKAASSPPEYETPDEQVVLSNTIPNSDPSENPESKAFLNTFNTNMDKFHQRMQYVTGRGQHVSTDTITQSLFQSVSAMHPQLLNMIEQQELENEKYEKLQEKINQVKEARQSLDAMRAQRREKLRQQELEQETLRRMQMEQKMELLRQQKQEYMLYQKQLQMHRQEEQRMKAEQVVHYPPSYGMYQQPGSGQYTAQPPPQETKTGLPDQYTPTYNPATQQPPSYQTVAPPGQPPQYQQQYHGSPIQAATDDRVPPLYQPGTLPPHQPSVMQQPRPNTQQPAGHPHQGVQLNQAPGTLYLDSDVVSDSPQLPGQGYPASGPLSYQGQQPSYNHTPPSSGPPSLEVYAPQYQGPPQGVTHPPQQQLLQPQPPTNQGLQYQPSPHQPAPPQYQSQPAPQQQPPPQQQIPQAAPQQQLPSQQPPPPQYQVQPLQQPPPHQLAQPQYQQPLSQYLQSQQPSDPTQYQSPPQQSWSPPGQYAPGQAPPPSYNNYEPVSNYNQQPFYEQNTAEAQLISFD